MNPNTMHARFPRRGTNGGLPETRGTTTAWSRRSSSGRQPRSAEAFLDEIREQISAGQILAARRLAEDAAASHPRHTELRNLHRILNQGGSYTLPGTGRSMRDEFEWLRDPPAEYRGQWVALIGREVVGSAATLKKLLASLSPDLEHTPLTVQVA
ncbi:MAG: hypothetical protein GY856_51505 [bacterium]|nr:hypothetical protein [bacterium]